MTTEDERKLLPKGLVKPTPFDHSNLKKTLQWSDLAGQASPPVKQSMHIHAYTYMYICIYTQTYVRTYVYTYTYAHARFTFVASRTVLVLGKYLNSGVHGDPVPVQEGLELVTIHRRYVDHALCRR